MQLEKTNKLVEEFQKDPAEKDEAFAKSMKQMVQLAEDFVEEQFNN